MAATWLGDAQLVAQARANPIENPRRPHHQSIVERMDENANIFRHILREHYLKRVFEQARTEA